MGGIDIPVNISLDGRVNRDYAETTDDFGIIGDFLIPKNDFSTVFFQISKKMLHPCFGHGE